MGDEWCLNGALFRFKWFPLRDSTALLENLDKSTRSRVVFQEQRIFPKRSIGEGLLQQRVHVVVSIAQRNATWRPA